MRHARDLYSRLALGLMILGLTPTLSLAFPKTTELKYQDKGPLVSWANQILAQEIKEVKSMKSNSFGLRVAEYDLNGDGVKERIVLIEDGLYYGQAGGNNYVYQKQGAKWASVFSGTGGGISIMPTKHKGYADILIAEPGRDIPVNVWDGKHYIFHHNENGFS